MDDTDEQEIELLIHELATTRDRADWSGAARLFEGATFETRYPDRYPGVGLTSEEVAERKAGTHGARRGFDETRDLFARTTRVYEDGLPHTLYQVSNIIVHVDDDRQRARARSYYVVFQSQDGFPLQPVSAGRYHDEFVRTPGGQTPGGQTPSGQTPSGWRFERRTIFADHSGDLSHHLAMDPLAYGAAHPTSELPTSDRAGPQ